MTTGRHRILTVLGSVSVAVFSLCPAYGQQPAADQDVYRGGTGYDATGLVSPSSGTSTVSPSSVPQAMDRMEDGNISADVSLGVIYSDGRFGTQSNTAILSSAIGARIRMGGWKLSASLPSMQIRSRSTIFTGIDATPVLVAPDTSSVKRTAEGFGDLTLGASYLIASESSPMEVELSGRAKLNTATERSRLSSGKKDYALGADVSVPLGKISPFVSISYRWLGDTVQYRLRDGPAASIGSSYALGPESFLLVSYHYSRSATRLVSDAHELFAGASTRIAKSPFRLTCFTTAGLSRGAAAVSGGVALSFRWKSSDAR